MAQIVRTLAKGFLFLLALWIASGATFGLVFVDRQSGIFRHLMASIAWAGYLHISCGALALVMGGFQLSARLRRKRLSLHRRMGWAYVLMVVLSSVGAMVSLPYSITPWPARSAFAVLGIAWPVVTLRGVPWDGAFDPKWHGKFMIYSYAMTCAAISLRVILLVLMISGASFAIAYPIAAWGGFLGNLCMAWLILQLQKKKPVSRRQPQLV